MKQLLLMSALIIITLGTAAAETGPAIIFSQEMVAIDADGNELHSVKIDPLAMNGMQTYNFDLGRQRQLQIETNISDAEQRGLADIVATIERCYDYIETATGQRLDRGVLLYLIELDQIPYAYNFSASYNDASLWGEVRLALIESGAPLSGSYAASSLTDLLYDTLPHELGHDVLDSIPQLQHDIDGSPSHYTRWFIEGVCEVLAKGFSQSEEPNLHRHFLDLRNVDTVLAERQMQKDLLNWAQNNDNGMVLESDLYGAAMLTLMAWTKALPLADLFGQIKTYNGSLRGAELVTMMRETSGVGMEEMVRRGHVHGMELKEKILLAQN